MGLDSLGQALQVVGAVLLVMGAMLLLVGRFPPLGWLPGDILVQRGRLTSYFPLATFLLLSLVATLVINLLLGLK